MKTKSLLTLTCALGLFCLGGQANAALLVTNGNFSNLTGLTFVGGGWYSGVPTGWSSNKPDTTYSVLLTGDTYVANLAQLTRTSPAFNALTQNVGTTDYFGDVTLKFDMSTFPNSPDWQVGAGIYSNNFGSLLATRQIKNGAAFADPVTGVVPNGIGTFELTALNVAAGSDIQVAFWTTGAAAGLTNVSISQVPEPGTWALLMGGLGMLGTLRRRSRQA
jgi:hypothetical protein